MLRHQRTRCSTFAIVSSKPRDKNDAELDANGVDGGGVGGVGGERRDAGRFSTRRMRGNFSADTDAFVRKPALAVYPTTFPIARRVHFRTCGNFILIWSSRKIFFSCVTFGRSFENARSLSNWSIVRILQCDYWMELSETFWCVKECKLKLAHVTFAICARINFVNYWCFLFWNSEGI